MKIEREALKRESDSASRERLDGLDGELADLEAEAASMTEQWQAEKDKKPGGVQELTGRARIWTRRRATATSRRPVN